MSPWGAVLDALEAIPHDDGCGAESYWRYPKETRRCDCSRPARLREAMERVLESVAATGAVQCSRDDCGQCIENRKDCVSAALRAVQQPHPVQE